MHHLQNDALVRLIELALADRLINAFRLLGEDVELVLGDTRLRLSPRRARTFLTGVLRGRSWHAGLEEPAPAPQHTPRLDELLTYANLLDLIEDYEKNPSNGTVTIRHHACAVSMPFADATLFLSDCIREELQMTEQTRDDAAAREPAADVRAPLDLTARRLLPAPDRGQVRA